MGNYRNRIEWVDIAKYICIMFVMLHHLESVTNPLTAFYSPFFMTVFFFLAGYVHNQSDTFYEHLSKKIKGLFVPWLVLSAFNILLSSLFSLKGNRNLISDLKWNILQVRGHGDGVWFVAALFMAFIPFYFLLKLGNRILIFVVAFGMALISDIYKIYFPKYVYPWSGNELPWHIEIIFIIEFWMALGYYFKGKSEAILDSKNTLKNRIIVLVIYFIIIMIQVDRIEITMLALLWGWFQNVVGLILIIMFAKSFKTNSYISFVGANTLVYFALHGKVYAVIEALLKRFFPMLYRVCLDYVWLSSLLAIVITLEMSLILIIPAYLIDRYMPWLLGRKRVEAR